MGSWLSCVVLFSPIWTNDWFYFFVFTSCNSFCNVSAFTSPALHCNSFCNVSASTSLALHCNTFYNVSASTSLALPCNSIAWFCTSICSIFCIMVWNYVSGGFTPALPAFCIYSSVSDSSSLGKSGYNLNYPLLHFRSLQSQLVAAQLLLLLTQFPFLGFFLLI